MRHLVEPIQSVLPLIGTLGCFALFCLVLFYVFSDRRRKHHDRMCRMPLEDDRHG